MTSAITRNSRTIDGLTSLTVTGNTALVEAEPGSRLDGLLGYQAAFDTRPRLGLQRDGDDKPRVHRRFAVRRDSEGVYTLQSEDNLKT